MKKEIIGTGVALVTPFDKERNIDFQALEKLVQHTHQIGVDYLVVMGTTAESATLSKSEKEEVKAAIKQANAGKLPMVLGLGGNNTQAVLEELKSTDLQDYTAILSVSPAYNKPTQEGIYQHFAALAQATDADIILYNVPGRTSSNIESTTTLRLAHEFKNIVAIKEASPNFLQSTEIIKDKLQDFLVLSGDDEFTLPMTLAGGSGAISVIGQALPQFAEMVQFGLQKEVESAYALHYQIMEITRAIYQEGNPAGIKALLAHQGICEPYTRLPLVPASDALMQEIAALYDNL